MLLISNTREEFSREFLNPESKYWVVYLPFPPEYYGSPFITSMKLIAGAVGRDSGGVKRLIKNWGGWGNIQMGKDVETLTGILNTLILNDEQQKSLALGLKAIRGRNEN